MSLKYCERISILSKTIDKIVTDHEKDLEQWHAKESEQLSSLHQLEDYTVSICNESKLLENMKTEYQKEVEALKKYILDKESIINGLMKTEQELSNEFTEISNSCKKEEEHMKKTMKSLDEKKETLKFYRRLTGVVMKPSKNVIGYTYNASKENSMPFILDAKDADKNCDTLWKQLEAQFL